MRKMVEFLKKDNGATAIEYSMIAAFVVLAIVASVSALGSGVKGLFGQIESAF